MKGNVTASHIALVLFLLCGAKEVLAEEQTGERHTLEPGYVTLKVSADGLHGDIVKPKDVRDKRIADLEKRVAILEAAVKTLEKRNSN